MPMPPDGAPWPLPELAIPWRAMAEWSAWYSGDTEALMRVYGALDGGASDRPDRPAPDAPGKVRNALRRWFWGQPQPADQRSRKLHMPAASEVCTTSANLLFSDPPAVRVPGGEDLQAAQDRLDLLFGEDAAVRLHGAAERAAALGGVYLRAGWDTDVADHPFLTSVDADAALPRFRYGRLVEVTFLSEVSRRDQLVYRHLEHHTRGAVEHALFQGRTDKLGRRVPLGELEGTAHLADAVNADGIVETGVDRLLVEYVANATGRRWRGLPGTAELGRSDLDGVEPALDALDRTWSSWLRDIDLGKARLIVPRAYLQSHGPGRGATFDEDQEVYAPVDAMLDREGLHITPSQFAIRHEAHKASSDAMKAAVVEGAGYNAQTFGLSGDVAMTATESNTRERNTNANRTQKTRRWGLAMANIGWTLMELDRVHFRSGVASVRPAVDWPPMVQEQPQTLAQTASLLRGAEAASTRTLVQLVHPGWTDRQVDDEVAAILESAPTPPGLELGGLGTDPAGDPTGQTGGD